MENTNKKYMLVMVFLFSIVVTITLASGLFPKLNAKSNILEQSKNYCDASFSVAKNTIFNNTQVRGVLYLNQLGSKPDCSSGLEGALWITDGTVGVSATSLEVCTHTILDAYAWLKVSLT